MKSTKMMENCEMPSIGVDGRLQKQPEIVNDIFFYYKLKCLLDGKTGMVELFSYPTLFYVNDDLASRQMILDIATEAKLRKVKVLNINETVWISYLNNKQRMNALL